MALETAAARSSLQRVESSFRDPSGYVFRTGDRLLRAIAEGYLPVYRRVMESGLAAELTKAGLLIPHREVAMPAGLGGEIGQVIQPEEVPYISYSSEWCVSQLRDAALTTLEIQSRAMQRGFSLKDSRASNIQFHEGRPVLIDTLSFEPLVEGRPWIAYDQFCRKFLAPLALATWRDPQLLRMERVWHQGLPLDLAVRLLPKRTWLRPGLLIHLHLHARAARQASRQLAAGHPRPQGSSSRRFSRAALEGLIGSLRRTVESLPTVRSDTLWSEYYGGSLAAEAYLVAKEGILREWLGTLRPREVWDLGGNDGRFARLAVGAGARVVCFDSDHASVDANYRRCRTERETRMLPLVQDLTNPSPSRGWDSSERLSWQDRGRPDLVLALALIHHLAIGQNLPFDRLAAFFARLAPRLLVEFVPKSDEKTRILLEDREDIFPHYDEDHFVGAFEQRFRLVDRRPVGDSGRVLMQFERRSA